MHYPKVISVSKKGLMRACYMRMLKLFGVFSLLKLFKGFEFIGVKLDAVEKTDLASQRSRKKKFNLNSKKSFLREEENDAEKIPLKESHRNLSLNVVIVILSCKGVIET